MKKIIIALVLLLVSFSVFANDIESFFKNKAGGTQSSTGSQTYKDKDYTYYQGSRFRVYNDPPVTVKPISITPPSISAGCSGIDLQMGGVNFANMKQYENMAKGALKSAPYVATQMAIKALSSETADTIAEFQALVDRLNSLQMDSCSAAQGLVTTVVNLTQDREATIKNAADKATAMRNGFKGDFDNLFDAVDNDINKIFGGVDNDVKTYGSLLDKMKKKVGLPSLYDVEEIRGMIGDILVGNNGNKDSGMAKSEIPSCASTVGFDNTYKKSNSTNAKCIVVAKTNIADVKTAILLNGDISSSLNFLNAVRFFNVYKKIEIAAENGDKDSVSKFIDEIFKRLDEKFPWLIVLVDAEIVKEKLVEYKQRIQSTNGDNALVKAYISEIDNYLVSLNSLVADANNRIDIKKLNDEFDAMTASIKDK